MTAQPTAKLGLTFWAMVPAALLTAMVGGLVTMAVIAQDDPGFAIERDYYQKAVHYDQEIAQREENARLGWRVRAVVGMDHPQNNPHHRTLTAHIEGPRAPITGAHVTLHAIRNASAARVIEAALEESAEERGTYGAELPLEPGGLWELRFTVTQANARYTESVRLDVPEARLAPAGARQP